ncbi:hypothetical protein N7456_004956 [Penicillium angulare]|uniref:Uncharacterized protein n=1 Tax=Penicillium angulare TaxID=116970 RepID=A0A9W9FXE7_9EURO|nr:hypothetical protein N7456_004956 [Penicillium angulare]
MVSDLLRPLVVFCSHADSQRYIKDVRNLGDAWRSLSEPPVPQCDSQTVTLETNFDFSFKIKNALEEQLQSSPTAVELSTAEALSATSTDYSNPTNRPRNYRIFADYGADFLWRDPDDVLPEEGDTVLDAEEFLAPFPPSVLELYDVWVNTYTENFSERREKPGDYHATTFPGAAEEVAWNVAGFLLAWRITMAPDVARIEFIAGDSKYFLEKGNETSVTLAFLQDQVNILAKGPLA